jgi:hypothetical protein
VFRNKVNVEWPVSDFFLNFKEKKKTNKKREIELADGINMGVG